AHLGAGDGCGAGTAAAAATAAGTAFGAGAAVLAGRGLRCGIGLALAALLLGLLGSLAALASFTALSAFTTFISVAALTALTTVAGWATLAAAAAFATGLAAGGVGRLGAGFVAAVTGEHAYQGCDQVLHEARLGFLDGAVGCGIRNECRRRCRGRGRASRSDALDCRLLANDGAGLADLHRLFSVDLGAHGVAGFAIEDSCLVVAQALYLEVRGVHVRVRQHQDADFGAGL